MITLNPFIFPKSKCIDIRVIDGDTFSCNIIHHLEDIDILVPSTIRINRLDAAEKNTYNGQLLKDIMNNLFSKAIEVEVQGIKKDLYGRVLGEVTVALPRIILENLSDFLLNRGVVVRAMKRHNRTASEESMELVNIKKLKTEIDDL